jgi:hypothetical protein
MATQKDNRLAWGITLLVFGIIFLLKQLNFMPEPLSTIIFDYKNYPLIMGLIFLLTHKNKSIGLVLIIVGVLFRLSDIIRWTQNISDYIWPVLLILAGVILTFGNIKGKK